MKSFSFGLILFWASIASAGSTLVVLDAAGPGETPGITDPTYTDGDTLPPRLYIWIKPEGENVVQAVSLDITSTNPAAVSLTGGEVYMQDFPQIGPRYNASLVEEIPDGQSLAGIAVTTRGLAVKEWTSLIEGDNWNEETGMFLYGFVDLAYGEPGDTELILSNGRMGFSERGVGHEDTYLLFGHGEESPGVRSFNDNGSTNLGATGLLPDASFELTVVPEPGAALLSLIGLFCLAFFVRRQ